MQPVFAMRGGEGDAVVDKWGRLRQKGLMRREDLANQSSGLKIERLEGVGVGESGGRSRGGGADCRGSCFALCGSCLILSCNVLSDPVLLGGGTQRE